MSHTENRTKVLNNIMINICNSILSSRLVKKPSNCSKLPIVQQAPASIIAFFVFSALAVTVTLVILSMLAAFAPPATLIALALATHSIAAIPATAKL